MNETTTMWMVRAGERGRVLEDFIEKKCVALGWGEDIDLTNLTSRDAIRQAYEKLFPEESSGAAVGMLERIRNVMRRGDLVLSYDPSARVYHVGRIRGDYRYDGMLIPGYPHIRDVEWMAQVARDDLSTAARNSLNSMLTIFQVAEPIASEILAVARGEQPSDNGEPAPLTEDIRETAREQIKDRIVSLDDRRMEELVAALLRAMGYRTRVSPAGPDRGVDVFASPDGLGLETPRIKVEVKHRRHTAMGAHDLRSFLGALREGDRGLYVSTGGFSREARYEAERSRIPVTLIDLDELAELIVTHYDRFDLEGRALVPLVQVYWPAD